jgi:hypothetical protein
MKMSYFTRIQELKQKECIENPSAQVLLSKIYNETCVSAVERSRVYALDTKKEALDEAINLIADSDLSTSKFWQTSFLEAQEGDPAMEAAIAHLAKHRRLALDDFTIEIDDL